MEADWLSLTPELGTLLLGLYRRQDRHPEYIFSNPKTGRPYTQRRRLIQGICRRAGIRLFGYHAIRHMGADWLMSSGADLRTISRFLRHKSLSTTEKYLRRRPDESLRKAARTLQDNKRFKNKGENSNGNTI